MTLVYIIMLFCLPGIVLSWVLPSKYQMIPSTVFTCAFLAIYSEFSLLALILSSLVGFTCLTYIRNTRTAAFLSAGTSLLMLFIYKMQSLQQFDNIDLQMIGISYYAFRQIHVAIEFYNGNIRKISALNYITYLFFLPTLLVGPINTIGTFQKDTLRRRIDPNMISVGLERVLYGLVKVSFLGNYLLSQKIDKWSMLQFEMNNIGAVFYHYIQAVKFVLNAYIQFSGYSDIAIGLSALFGYTIIENFNYPFKSISISEFWKRWHISLSNWCRQYIFLPLMAKTRSAAIALVVSMLVLGIWHEISLKYLIWAVIQGLALLVWKYYKESKLHFYLDQYKWNYMLSWFINFHFVVGSFYILSFNSFSGFIISLSSVFYHDI